jgi:hypothetical protein
MNRARLLFFGTVMSVGSLFLASTGCGGGKEEGTGGESGTGGSPAVATCDSYCTAIMTNCVEGEQQYPDAASCNTACAALPAGAAGDTMGDSLACRAYHATAAQMDPATHCAHAGPTGGDKDPTDTAGGPCGEGCEAFCKIALAVCGTAGTYADEAACLTECKTFNANVADYSIADTATNDFGCRVYHLTVAATSTDAAPTHCPAVTSSSDKCVN